MLKSIKKTNITIIAAIMLIMGFITIYTMKNINVNEIIVSIETMPYLMKASVMIGLTALQIFLAFIPGEPLELASGYIFGSLSGTIICLIGSMVGTIIVYYLAKIFQHSIVDKMFNQDKVAEVKRLFTSKKSKFWLFIIFLIPGSPKDVMTYLVSLSDIDLKQWLLLTTIGRIPSIVTSTYLTGSLKEGNIMLAVWIFAVTIVLVIGGTIYYKKIINANKNDKGELENGTYNLSSRR